MIRAHMILVPATVLLMTSTAGRDGKSAAEQSSSKADLESEQLWGAKEVPSHDSAPRNLSRRLTEYHFEDTATPARSQYLLGGIVVQEAAWHVRAITGYFRVPTLGPNELPRGWSQVARARFNLWPRTAATPAPTDDPTKGKVIPVTVTDYDGVVAVRADDLDLTISRGEYWIGLTPIIDREKHGVFQQFMTHDRSGRGIEPVMISPGGDEQRQPRLAHWATLHEARYFARPWDEDLQYSIEGTRVLRGERVAWPELDRSVDKSAQIRLRFAEFDPLVAVPPIREHLRAKEDCRLAIVQFRQCPGDNERGALTDAGATLRWYLPDNAYLVEADPGSLTEIRQLESVRWVGPYHPAYRVDVSVDGKDFRIINTWLQGDATRKEIVVQTVRPGGEQKRLIEKRIEALGGQVLAAPEGGYRVIARLSREGIDQLARLDEVFYIHAVEVAPQVLAQVTQGSEPGRLAMSDIRELEGADVVAQQLGCYGAGVMGAVIDSGIRETHQDFVGRVTFLPGVHPRGGGFNHGTAVTGIIIGDGATDERAVGLLPKGRVSFVSGRSESLDDQYAIMRALLASPYEAVFQSSSTNDLALSIGFYGVGAMELDDRIWKYDLLTCQAFGNSGDRMASSKAFSKNALTVGGIDAGSVADRSEHRPLRGSSIGPAPDGRIKPDLVNFAYDVHTTSSRSDDGHGMFAGTSCATPITSGCLGLLFEMWSKGAFENLPIGRTVFQRRPRASTAKALLLNSASPYPLKGTDPAFDRFRQGWGLPDLATLVRWRDRMFMVDGDTPLEHRAAWQYTVTVPKDSPTLHATLVWTDPPGAVCAERALVNDLDLVVQSPTDETYLGNHQLVEALSSTQGGSPDELNNVEQVIIHAPQEGQWQVLVCASRVVVDQNLSTPELDTTFSLVVRGVEQNAERETDVSD